MTQRMTRRIGNKISSISFLVFVAAGLFTPDAAFSQCNPSLKKIYFDTCGDAVTSTKPIRANDLDIIKSGGKTYLFVATGEGVAVYDTGVANNTPPYPGNGKSEKVLPVESLVKLAGAYSDTDEPSLSLALTPDGNTLVCAWRVGDLGIKLIDASNKENLNQVLNTLNTGPLNKVRTFARGTSEYVVGNGNSVVIVDITTLTNPILKSEFFPTTYDFVVRDPYVYIAAGSDGLKIYNIQNLGLPGEVTLTPSPAFGNYRGVAVDGQYIYLAKVGGVLEIWEANFTSATTATATRRGTYTTSATPPIQVNRINADYPYVYLSGACSGFEVVDASTLSAITSVYVETGTCGGNPDPDPDLYDYRTIMDPDGGYFYRGAHCELSSYEQNCFTGPSLSLTSETVTADTNPAAPSCGNPWDPPTNCNGLIDPGEELTLSLTVRNSGSDMLLGAAATLTATAGVTVTPGTPDYPALIQGASASRSFTIQVPSNATGTISFNLHLASGADFFDLPFTMPIQPASAQLVLGLGTVLSGTVAPATATIEFKNLGTAGTGAFVATLTTSTQGVSVDAPGTQSYSSLGVGEAQSHDFPVTFSGYSGTFVTFTATTTTGFVKTFNLDTLGFKTAPALIYDSRRVVTVASGLDIFVKAKNLGANLTSGAAGTLSMTGGTDVTLTTASSTYPAISANATGENTTPYKVAFGANPSGIAIFTATVSKSGETWQFSFQIDFDALYPELAFDSSTWTESTFGGDGKIQRGESGGLNVKLRNNGLGDATNVAVTISSNNDAYIEYDVYTPPQTRYYTIPAGGTATQTYGMLVLSTFPPAANTVTFTLTADPPFTPNSFTRTVDGVTTPCSSDTVPPTVSMTEPSANAILVGTVSVSGTASDASGMSSVVLLANGISRGSLTNTGGNNYSMNFNTTTLANGSYGFQLKATDTCTNSATTSSRTVTVQNGTTPCALTVFASYSMGGCTASTCTVSAGVPVQFTDTSFVAQNLTAPPVGGANGWAWDFNNDGTIDSTVQNPQYTYPSNGTYTAKLTAKYTTTQCTIQGVKLKTVTVTTGGLPALQYDSVSWIERPIAGDGRMDKGESGILRVKLRNTGTGPATAVPVTLTSNRDGTFTYQNSVANFNIAAGALGTGDYLLDIPASFAATSIDFTLTATSPAFTQTFSQSVGSACPGGATLTGLFTIGSCASGSCTVGVNRPIQFNDLSTVTDGSSTLAATAWNWDLNGDGVSDSALKNPLFTYATTGTYSVRLIVTYSTATCFLQKTVLKVLIVSDGPVMLDEQLFVPAAAHVAGKAGSTWRSNVTLFNPSSVSSELTIKFLATEANNVVPAESVLTLAPLETREVGDILGSLFHVTSDAGAVQMEVQNTEGVVPIVNSSTYNDLGTGGTYGQFIAARPFSLSALVSGAPSRLIGLSDGNGYRSNIGVVNTTAVTTTYRFSFFDAAGAAIGTPYTDSLGPYGHRQYNQAEMNNRFGIVNRENFRADVAVTGGGSIFAYASVVDPSGDPLYMEDGSGNSSTSQVLLGVANEAGLNGTRWKTEAYFHNPGTSTMTMTLQFIEKGPTPPNYPSKVFDLAPGTTRKIDDIVGSSEFFNLAGKSGAIIASGGSLSERPIVSSRTYNTTPAGKYGQYIPAVSVADAAVGGAPGQDTMYIVGVKRNAGFRSNLILYNVGESVTTFDIILRDAEANTLISPGHVMNPRTYKQEDIFAMVGLATGNFQEVTAEIIVRQGYLLAMGSVIDQITGDPSRVSGVFP